MRALAGQFVLYAAFAAAIGVFAHWPRYQHLAPGRALVKLSMVHHGQRLGDCVELTPEDLAALPPNMRTPTRCPRERAPVLVEVDIDGAPAIRRSARPSGLARDGASVLYQRVEVAAGRHRIAVRLRDRASETGFDHQLEQDLELVPGEILVVDFDAESQRIALR